MHSFEDMKIWRFEFFLQIWLEMPIHAPKILVTSFKFRQNRMNRFRDVEGRNLRFPILKASGLYNSLYYRTSRDTVGVIFNLSQKYKLIDKNTSF